MRLGAGGYRSPVSSLLACSAPVLLCVRGSRWSDAARRINTASGSRRLANLESRERHTSGLCTDCRGAWVGACQRRHVRSGQTNSRTRTRMPVRSTRCSSTTSRCSSPRPLISCAAFTLFNQSHHPRPARPARHRRSRRRGWRLRTWRPVHARSAVQPAGDRPARVNTCRRWRGGHELVDGTRFHFCVFGMYT